jgi:hypothetical protein
VDESSVKSAKGPSKGIFVYDGPAGYRDLLENLGPGGVQWHKTRRRL